MGNLYRWCLVGLLAAFFLGKAVAETKPATVIPAGTSSARPKVYVQWNTQAPTFQTVQEVCDSYRSSGLNKGNCVDTIGTWSSYGAAGDCKYQPTNTTSCISVGTPQGVYGSCPVGSTISGANCVTSQEQVICEAGWTVQGTSCFRPDCAAGYDRNSQGRCVKDCTSKAGQPTTNGNYSFTGAVSTWSVSECKVSCAQRVLTAYGGSGYECKYTGASATPEDTSGEALPPDPEKLPPEKPEDCLNRGSGYVTSSTGKITCVPSSEAPEGQKPNKKEADNVKESGTKNPDGTIDKTSPDYKKEETSTSQGSDGTTTTNKTETVAGTNDGNGNVTCPTGYTKNPDNTCSKTTTTQQTNSGFCEQNPNSPLCKEAKESRFGGGCDSGFVCEGDAATCASARASHELKCSFQPDSTTGLHDAENPGGTGPQVAKAAEALNADGTKDFNIASEFSSKNQQWVNFSSGCPVGVQQFSILGKTLEVDASIVCDIGLFIRLMVHIVAYLGLARVFATKLV